MDKLKYIIDRCKAGIHVSINEHKNYHETAEYYLRERKVFHDAPIADKEIIDEMINRNTIIHLQFYPNTPVCFHSVHHYDIDKALEEGVEILKDLDVGGLLYRVLGESDE